MKLIASILATLALLFGGTVALAPAATADGINTCGGLTGIPCDPEPCGGITGNPCPEPSTNCGLNAGPCSTSGLGTTTCAAAEPAAASVSPALVRKVDRLQRIADKRAATIKRLRAQLRAQR